MLEINRLIAEVKERDDIRIEPGDPAFALVTLNQLILEDVARQLGEQLRSGIREFNEVVQKTEARAGKVLAQYVKAASTEIRQELRLDVENARAQTTEIIDGVHRAHSRWALIRLAVAGLIGALALFSAGLWTGLHCVR